MEAKMVNTFFMHRIKHDTSKEGSAAWDKGIEVHDTPESAKQSYHAYLGAYAYGHGANIDFVACEITDTNGLKVMEETWKAPESQE